MIDFNLKQPTEIIFGKNKESLIGKRLQKNGIKKVLFVYGSSSIKSTGLHERVISYLKESQVDYIEYSGIQSNPLLSDVNMAAQLGIKEKVDAVLAVGGGSVMDSAKAIAAGIYMKCDVWDFYNGKKIEGALPIYNIVTLAATASEMNSGFVITNDKTKEKLGNGSEFCYPTLSILNPELTYTVPPNYTTYGGIDIIAHILEGYLTATNINNMNCRFRESVIKSVMESLELIQINPEDYDARAEFMWAATVALNGTLGVGVGGGSFPNHMIEHGMGGVHNIPHGAGLSIIIPAWMKWYKDKNPKQFLRLSKEIFGKDNIDDGIKALESWFHSQGSPVKFSEYSIDESSFDDITEKAYTQAKKWGMDDAYPKDTIKEILLLAK